jgi:hypothetical protein
MHIFIFGAVIFVVSLILIEMFLYAYKIIRYPESGKIRKRLKTISSGELVDKPLDIISPSLISAECSFITDLVE